MEMAALLVMSDTDGAIGEIRYTSRYLNYLNYVMGWIAYKSDLEFECIPHRYNI